ncbi:MAG TPA: ROK family transcriptional regulator [Aestuariivirga sp.]
MDWTGGGLVLGKGPTLARGTTQNGVRLYNERLALSLIRRHGSLPKAEIARLTGLSAQTVSVIVRQLETDQLLIKERPQRGKVGQPLVPFSLNPDGAFSIGLKVGRRSGDLILLDLTGKVRRKVHQPYLFPTPQRLMEFVSGGLEKLLSDLTPAQRERICGLGIAAPFELWNWEEEIGAAHEVLEAWRDFDLIGEIARLGDWPVHFSNDATAACAAELLFGRGNQYHNYAYFSVGYFIGGGIVINGHVLPGKAGYAGAIGSLPLSASDGTFRQLIHKASLFVLENRLQAAGLDHMVLARSPDDWGNIGLELDIWLEQTAKFLAHAAVAAMSVIDFEAIIIDGAMPADVRRKLVEKTCAALKQQDLRGLPKFSIEEGSIGSDARAMGAASLSLFANYIIDRDVLFKETL